MKLEILYLDFSILLSALFGSEWLGFFNPKALCKLLFTISSSKDFF